jgi:transposase
VGSRRDCTWILGLSGFRVVTMDEADSGRLQIQIARRGVRRDTCSGCGRRTGRVRSSRERTWDDLPWAAHHVRLVHRQRRLACRRCGVRTERIEFADVKARVTRRLRQQLGVDCQSMPTRHAAVRHGVSGGKARRAEKAFLAEWDHARVKGQPRHIGLDEIQRGKGQRFWMVLSDVMHGEVIGLRHDRSETTAATLLTEDLTGRQRGAITAVCTDMHRPYLNAVAAVLPQAEIVFDKFHVLQHASAALDEVRWQRLPEMERPGDFVRKHIEGIAAYCDHAVRFGVVESINTTITAELRRARGMRDEAMLLLKLKWATAHPIRSARDLMCLLIPQALYSNR